MTSVIPEFQRLDCDAAFPEVLHINDEVAWETPFILVIFLVFSVVVTIPDTLFAELAPTAPVARMTTNAATSTIEAHIMVPTIHAPYGSILTPTWAPNTTTQAPTMTMMAHTAALIWTDKG